MITPLAFVDSLRIGSVDFISPDEIKVLLDIEAPSDVALNAGIPRPFPRISSYVLLPCDSGFLVAQIEWITIERSPYPKRKGMQDFGIIDLPFPLRKMSLTPLGVLKEKKDGKNSKFVFSRGVEAFPTVGDPVLLPSQDQLISIVESGEKRRVKIGTSPLASNADVSVDPDRLFGRHLAILGNTGSGKSCSVAGMIRWSIESAKKSIENKSKINSRFIILDPNGEYSEAFEDMDNVRLFAVEENKEKNIKQLQVPLWFWNSNEWSAFTQASSRTQRPTLIQALRTVRDGELDLVSATPSHNMRRYLRTLISALKIIYINGEPWASGTKNFGKRKGFYDGLLFWQNGLTIDTSFSTSEEEALNKLKDEIGKLLETYPPSERYPSYLYDEPTVLALLNLFSMTHSVFGGSDTDVLPIDADIPRPFTGDDLLRSLEANGELMRTSEHIETMLMRIRTLLSDSRMKLITSSDDGLTLDKWLSDYICTSDSPNGAITIIDLSLVPAEVVHIVTSIIARMTLEALQRYRQLNNGNTLPTALIMEEAHTFIRRYANDSEETPAYSMCSQVFEKIAREGRKFGLGLVLSSQRPSELSPTVLSQCNTFLLHRISNDRDQELVSKLVPDNLRGLLRELPSLPSQRAILLGWASELPVMVQMNYLDVAKRPKSNDPNYWDVWTITDDNALKADWKAIADNWQRINESDENEVNSDVLDENNDEIDSDMPF